MREFRMEDRIQKKELMRFLLGGGSAVVVDFATYHFFIWLGIGRDLAKGISFFCGAAVGFIINKLWTFESKGISKGEIIRYVILYSCTSIINALTNRLVFILLPVEIVGFLCATGVSTVLNFLGQKYFVFRKKGSGDGRMSS